MFNLPLDNKYIFPPLILIMVSTLFMLFDANPLLEFNRATVEQRWWTIITSQFVHANWAHLGLNILGIVFIWLLHAEHRTPFEYCWHTLVLATVTGLSICLYSPNIQIYTGLSGLLHGLIVWGAVKDIQHGIRSGLLLFIGIWIKLAWEQLYGPSADVGSLIESRVAIEAHLAGAIGGLVLSVPVMIQHLNRTKEKSANH